MHEDALRHLRIWNTHALFWLIFLDITFVFAGWLNPHPLLWSTYVHISLAKQHALRLAEVPVPWSFEGHKAEPRSQGKNQGEQPLHNEKMRISWTKVNVPWSKRAWFLSGFFGCQIWCKVHQVVRLLHYSFIVRLLSSVFNNLFLYSFIWFIWFIWSTCSFIFLSFILYILTG